jgi:hypothetical protein
MGLCFRTAAVSRILLILGLLVVLGAAAAPAAGPGQGPGDARVLEGIEGFRPDYDSGNMGLHALSSCLKPLGAESGYYMLVGLSRCAFKFVYDTTEAYEPLRDLYPMDALRQAGEAVGFPDCHWEVNKSINTVKSLIKQEIDGGRAVIAPFLLPDAYHGFYVITGYDYARGLFYVQGAFEPDSGYVTVAIPDFWDGPTASPEGWARNPVFILGEKRQEMSRRGTEERKSVRMGIKLMKGGTLEYGTQPGERKYMRTPGPHEARYGLPAYDLLSHDVEAAPLIYGGDGLTTLNFGLIWRLDAQLGQLEHDRHHGSTYVRGLSRYLRFEQNMLLAEIMGNFENVVQDVRSLRKIFWDPVPDWCVNSDDVLRYIDSNGSIVYRVPDIRGIDTALASRDLSLYDTPWGRVVVLDSPSKRLKAKLLVKSIASREKNSLYVMQDIVEYIGRLDPDALKRETDEDEGGRPGQQ